MAEITVTKQVNAPVEQLFNTWCNEFADIYKFHAGLKSSHLLSNSPVENGVGALRQCNMSDGKNWIKEKLVKVVNNKRLEIDIYDFSMPMKSARGIIDFSSRGNNKSHIQFNFQFQPGLGLLGKLMTPLMKRQYRPILQAMLDDNARYVERGKQVNETIQAA